MWHCDIANVRKIDYGTLTPSLLSLNLVRKLWCCDAHKFQGPIPHSPNRAPSGSVPFPWSPAVYYDHQSLVSGSPLPCEKRNAWGGGWCRVELAIIMSYPTSASGISVSLKTSTKNREFFPTLFVKTTDFQLVFNFERMRTAAIFGKLGIMVHIR